MNMKDLVNEAGGAVAVFSSANSIITLTVNHAAKQLVVAPWTTLLDLLRERLDLTGTKERVRPRPMRRVYGLGEWQAHQFMSDVGDHA